MDYHLNYLQRNRRAGILHVESRHLAIRTIADLLGQGSRVTSVSVNGRPLTAAQERHLVQQARLARSVSACLSEQGCDLLHPSGSAMIRPEQTWENAANAVQPLLL